MMELIRAWRAVGLSALFLAISLSGNASDPVVMTVGTDSILFSELSGAYKQAVREAIIAPTVSDFAKSYAIFRQKVCYARHCGIDTLASFCNELNSLSAPGDTSAILRIALRDALLASKATEIAVWQAAAADTTGLERYFNEWRRQYRWHRQRYKGYVVLTRNDSVMQQVMSYLSHTRCSLSAVADSVDRHFHGDAYAWPVLAAEGTNQVVDYVAFGKPKPEAPVGRWHEFAAYGGRIIAQPETASDVRETLYPDWLSRVERKWLEDLEKRYPVKINKKLLKKVK